MTSEMSVNTLLKTSIDSAIVQKMSSLINSKHLTLKSIILIILLLGLDDIKNTLLDLFKKLKEISPEYFFKVYDFIRNFKFRKEIPQIKYERVNFHENITIKYDNIEFLKNMFLYFMKEGNLEKEIIGQEVNNVIKYNFKINNLKKSFEDFDINIEYVFNCMSEKDMNIQNIISVENIDQSITDERYLSKNECYGDLRDHVKTKQEFDFLNNPEVVELVDTLMNNSVFINDVYNSYIVANNELYYVPKDGTVYVEKSSKALRTCFCIEPFVNSDNYTKIDCRYMSNAGFIGNIINTIYWKEHIEFYKNPSLDFVKLQRKIFIQIMILLNLYAEVINNRAFCIKHLISKVGFNILNQNFPYYTDKNPYLYDKKDFSEYNVIYIDNLRLFTTFVRFSKYGRVYLKEIYFSKESSSKETQKTNEITLQLNFTNLKNKEIYKEQVVEIFNQFKGKKISGNPKIFHLSIERTILTEEKENPKYQEYSQIKEKLLSSEKMNDNFLDILQSIPEKTITTEKETRKIKVEEKTTDCKPFNTLFLPHREKQILLSKLDNFQEDKIFKKFGVRRKLGCLFHGLAGTGKSSTILAIATYLNRDIYYISLEGVKTNRDIQELFDYINNNTEKDGIIVLEEVDNYELFRKSKSETLSLSKSFDNIDKSLDIGYFLQILDGTLTKENTCFILTTNFLEKLDERIYRDMRVDTVIEFKNCNNEMIKDIFKSILNIELNDSDVIIEEYSITPSKLISFLLSYVNFKNLDGVKLQNQLLGIEVL